LLRLQAFRAPFSSSRLPGLLIMSGLAFSALALLPHGELGHSMAQSGFSHPHGPIGWIALSEFAGWSLMVVAMMTPLVAHNLYSVRISVEPRLRLGATAAFLLGYWSIWCVAGIGLFPMANLARATMGEFTALAATTLGAIVYSASPVAQLGRNLCHQAARIRPFGLSALSTSARFGGITAMRCALVCWPWMIAPMTTPTYHILSMILVTAYLFADRIAPPSTPRWQTPPALETVFGPRLTHGEMCNPSPKF